MSDIRNRAAEQHARRIKALLELFWCGTMPAWAIDAIEQHAAELHRAVFPPASRGPAKILPFIRKGARGHVGTVGEHGK